MRTRIYVLGVLLVLLVLGLMFFIPERHTASENNASYIIDEQYKAQAASPRIDFIVLHFTHANFKSSLNTFTHGDVSAHYLVPEDPIDGQDIIYRLVKDESRAAHAGLSYWRGQYSDGEINLNATSIGVELVNLGFKYEKGVRRFFPYTDYQINLTIALLKDLIKKYDIAPTHIVGHADITPNIAARGDNIRVDPGPLFPWEKLAAEGIGAWYDREVVDTLLKNKKNNEVDILRLQKNLARYGYNIKETGVLDAQTRNVVTAFQMHFRPSDYSGTPDLETCAILQNLIDKYFPMK